VHHFSRYSHSFLPVWWLCDTCQCYKYQRRKAYMHASTPACWVYACKHTYDMYDDKPSFPVQKKFIDFQTLLLWPPKNNLTTWSSPPRWRLLSPCVQTRTRAWVPLHPATRNSSVVVIMIMCVRFCASKCHTSRVCKRRYPAITKQVKMTSHMNIYIYIYIYIYT
jgi:hypothetical protein